MAVHHGRALARGAVLAAALLTFADAPARAASRGHGRDAGAAASCNDAFAHCQRACAVDESDCTPACEGCTVEQSDEACRRSRQSCHDDCDRGATRCQLRCEDRFGGCVTD